MPISGADAGAGLGAAGDLFQGIAGFMGSKAEAKAYKQAAKFAHQNAVISREAGDIKLAQTGRAIFKTLGAQGAGYAAAGLTGGGSAQAILRDSISQGALEKAIVNEQANIDVLGYMSQEAQFKGMAKAAKAAGKGKLLGGILSAAATLAPLVLSDPVLKTDVKRVGSHGKLGIYNYRLHGEDRVRVGVMADEVAIHAPHALWMLPDGTAAVDYGKLGLGHLVEA